MDKKMTKIRVMYRRSRFTVMAEAHDRCECCGAEGKLDRHHWRYEFPTKDVRKDPPLAVMNTSVLCFNCHKAADALRAVLDIEPAIIGKLKDLRIHALLEPLHEPKVVEVMT